MITIKQVEKDERWAFTVIKKFIKDHPVFLMMAGTIFLIFALLAINTIMLCAAVGISNIQTHGHEQLLSGEMTPEYYSNLLNVLNIAIFFYNSISISLSFIISGIILLVFYYGFKFYLQYKRDNL